MGDPITTIPPFSNTAVLPVCASFCGPLFDANGACVPPAVPTAQPQKYTDCFCSFNALKPFSTATAGVCDAACAGTNGLNTIAAWFRDTCDIKKPSGGNGGGADGDGSSSSVGSEPTGSSGGSNNGGGGDWFSTHWKWVILLIVLVVGITGIWVGACIWRRRYLKKKDRQSSLGQKHSGSASRPSWGPPMVGDEAPVMFGTAGNRDSGRSQNAFMMSSGVEESSREKKKWRVSQRT